MDLENFKRAPKAKGLPIDLPQNFYVSSKKLSKKAQKANETPLLLFLLLTNQRTRCALFAWLLKNVNVTYINNQKDCFSNKSIFLHFRLVMNLMTINIVSCLVLFPAIIWDLSLTQPSSSPVTAVITNNATLSGASVGASYGNFGLRVFKMKFSEQMLKKVHCQRVLLFHKSKVFAG